MSVPIEATRKSNNNVSSEHDNWDIIGDVDVYIWRCKLVVRLSYLMLTIYIDHVANVEACIRQKEHPTSVL